MREIVRNAGLPKPDEVRYEFEPDEVVFKWTGPKLAVVIDLDNDGCGQIELPLAEETRPAPRQPAGRSALEPTARESREAGSRVASMGPLASDPHMIGSLRDPAGVTIRLGRGARKPARRRS